MNPPHQFTRLRRALALGWVLFCAGFVWPRLLVAGPDYLVDGWDTENNLPSSTVTSIAQTPDGYLWVGTYNGLARFDGSRFVTFDPVNTPALTQARVKGLYLDAAGTLWINTFRGGLTSYRDGQFRNEWPDQAGFDLKNTLVHSTRNRVVFVMQFGEVLWRDNPGTNWHLVTPPAPMGRPIFQCADGEGRLWFLTRDGHIVRFDGEKFERLPEDGGLSGSKIITLASDARGRVWAGAEDEIALWHGRRFEAMTPTNRPATLEPRGLYPLASGDVWVLDGERLRKLSGRAWTGEIAEWRGLLGPAAGRAMGGHEDRAGGLWFNHYGNGLFHIPPAGSPERITTASGLSGDRVGAWFQSRDGGIWAGVDHGGLVRLRDRQFQVIGPAEGLPARTALSVCGEATGAVWIGTAGGGLCRWRQGRLEVFPVGTSASENFIFSIVPRADGGLWLSASEGEDLYEFQEGRIQRGAWEVHGVKSLLMDRHRRLWLGLKAGAAYVRERPEERQVFNGNDQGFLPAVRALAEAPNGTVWAGADDGTIFRCETNGLTPFRAGDRLAGQAIYSLYADTNGVVWAGTFRGGLVRFKEGKFARIAARQGLPADVISQILEDDMGRLWLGTHQGLYCVNRSELNDCAEGVRPTVNVVAYGRHYGLPSLEFSDGYQPAAWRAPDGRLWFTTARGVVWVDPAKIVQQSSPPAVIIEELRVDNVPGELRAGPVIIPPGRKQLDFRYTALSFDAGDRARFRYQLEGFDSGWVDAETRRTAHYANLPPRDYRFRVIACNNEGVWNEVGAAVDFTVKPRFHQTPAFILCVGLLSLGGIIFGVRRVATGKYRRQLAALEKQHAIERDRARIAKDIHDDIGAGLTQITLLTELARRDPAQTEANLGRITDSARRLTKAMDEIVWAVDPQHDTVAGFMDYASAYAEDFLRMAEIRCRMDLPVTLPETRVEAESRYHLFLALKEALNNIVKHARATEVWLRLKLEPRWLTLVVEDNGRGIAADSPAAGQRISSGAGLGNLDQRLAAIGGHCRIHSEPGRGTRVELTIRLPAAGSPVVAMGPAGPAGYDPERPEL